MDTLLKLIGEVGVLRPGIPQFLFFGDVYPNNAIIVRSEILRLKAINPDVQEIDFIINSPGGIPDDSYRIIRTLRKNFTTVNIIIPFWAKSAATLLAIGGSKIIMGEFGEFGPLDVQLPKDDDNYEDRESALIDEMALERIESRAQERFITMFRVIRRDPWARYIPKPELANTLTDYLAKLYSPLLSQINPYKIGDKKRKLDIGTKYAERILTQYNEVEDRYKRDLFIDFLVNACPHHGYVIDYDIVRHFLPNVVPASELGKQYESKLSEITSYFMEQEEEETYIGFVEPLPSEPPIPAPLENNGETQDKNTLSSKSYERKSEETSQS